jgi:hypothetical protein
MGQRTTEIDSNENRDAEMNIDPTLSEESKRQREGTGNIGAFGKRTGSSDLRSSRASFPRSTGKC